MTAQNASHYFLVVPILRNIFIALNMLRKRERESRQQGSHVVAYTFSHDALHRAFVVRIEVDQCVHIPTETSTTTHSAAPDDASAAADYERRPATPPRL